MTAAIMLMAASLAAAAEGASATPGKLAPEVSKQMVGAIVALNKVLGLESWPNAKPCVDRGGQGITAKDVTADETRKCAETAITSGFPELGTSFVLAIPMASIGPVTVMALGIGDSSGWAAYSCDPARKCLPVKIGGTAKWSKRVAERQAKACSEATTIWFPADKRACPAADLSAVTPPPQ
jgi:hypothetical protein